MPTWLVMCALAPFVLASFPIAALDFDYVYDSLNRLGRVIDSEGNVLTYNYDEVGNIELMQGFETRNV